MNEEFPAVGDIVSGDIRNLAIRNGIHKAAVFAKKYCPVHHARDARVVFDGAADDTGASFVSANDSFVPTGMGEAMVFSKRNDRALRALHAECAELRDGCFPGK